jgi:flagellar hook-basal body complex protein FliE
MAAMNPISSVRGVQGAMPSPATRLNENPTQKAGFGDVLKTFVNNVDAKQQASEAAIQDLVTGKTDNVLPVVNAVAKADLSFKLLVGVRNKVIDAYKETMRMQV